MFDQIRQAQRSRSAIRTGRLSLEQQGRLSRRLLTRAILQARAALHAGKSPDQAELEGFASILEAASELGPSCPGLSVTSLRELLRADVARFAGKALAGAGTPAGSQPEAAVAADRGHVVERASDTATDRRAMVDAFLRKCEHEAQFKAIRKDIWRVGHYKWPRQFQYWQTGQDRRPGERRGASKQDDQSFRRILAMEPAEFVAAAKKNRPA
jgi:hypothetical protein